MKPPHLFGALIMFCALTQNQAFSQGNILPQNGNVGIGTTNPTEKLQVNGSARIDSMLVVKDSMIVHKGSVMQDNLTVEGNLKVDGNSYFNQPIYYSNYPALSPTASGLKLLATDATGMVKSFGLSDLLTVPSLLQCQVNPNGTYLPYWVSGDNKITVNCPNTKVGINTSSPTHNLHLVGNQLTEGSGQFNEIGVNALPSGGYSRFKINTGTNYGAALEITGNTTVTNKLLLMYSNHPSTEIFKVVNTQDALNPIFYMQANGSFYIRNATQKTLQLTQDGLLQARKIRVDVVNWPDYVFSINHKLPTIEEVETYIEENNHLPGIPAASTIEQEGLDVAETNRMLMEQLEEQMLYIIQLKKELEALKVEVNEIKKGE